jgi:hypothetical protein
LAKVVKIRRNKPKSPHNVISMNQGQHTSHFSRTQR